MRPLFGFSISRVFLLFHDNVVMLILLHFLSLLEIKSPDWKGKNEPEKDGYPDYNTGNMSDKIMPESQVISCKFFHCFATLKLVLNVTELRANQPIRTTTTPWDTNNSSISTTLEFSVTKQRNRTRISLLPEYQCRQESRLSELTVLGMKNPEKRFHKA